MFKLGINVGLAVAAVTVALTVAPGVAQAEESGEQTVSCVTTDNGEVVKRAVGELYKEVDRQVASTYVYAERTTVYLCTKDGSERLLTAPHGHDQGGGWVPVRRRASQIVS